MEKQAPTKEKGAMLKSKLIKWGGPMLAALFVIVGLIIASTIIFPPKSGKGIPTDAKPDTSTEISTETLQINALEAQMKTTKDNIQKMYANQVKLNTTLTELTKSLEAQKKVEKENRAYIAMIYQKVLDLELQVQSLGGGFNLKTKPREETINPLMGTEELPQNP